MSETLWHSIRRPLACAAVAALFAVFPLLVALTAGLIARLNGCTLNEGNPHPCVICGKDIGETLYSIGVMAWLSVITLPFGCGVAFVYAVVCVVELLKWAIARK